MPRLTHRLALAAALAALPLALAAQRVDSLIVGARVRVEVREAEPPLVIGRFEGRAGDGALVVRPDDAPGMVRTIDRDRVRALALSAERLDAGQASRRGALRGFLFGGGIALAGTALTAGLELRGGGDTMGIGTVVVGAAGLALTGVTTAIGAASGRQARDRWVAVPVP